MKRTTGAAIAAASLPPRCSGQHSEDGIEESVDAFVAEFGKIVAVAAKSPLRVDSVEDNACTPAQDATYVCDITMTVPGRAHVGPFPRRADPESVA